MNKTENLRIEIGNRVKNIRENNMHMTKSDFAKLINMTNQYLGTVETGKKGLTIEKAIEICNKTGVSADYLLRGINNTMKENAKDLLSNYTNSQIETSFNIMKDLLNFLR